MTMKHAFINFLFSEALILAIIKTILLTFFFQIDFYIIKSYIFCPIHKIVSRLFQNNFKNLVNHDWLLIIYNLWHLFKKIPAFAPPPLPPFKLYLI